MALDLGEVIETGFRRTIARNGLIIAAVLFVLSALNALVANSMFRAIMPPPNQMGPGFPGGPMAPGPSMMPMGPSLPISPAVAGLLSFIVSIITAVVTITAIRTFVSGETEQIPEEYYTRNMIWALINLIVGGIVFGVIVAIGLILLIIPGIFLLVSLFFWNVFVVVKDQNFIEGLQNSWALTKGNRLRLFLLGIVVVVIVAVVNGIFGIFTFFGGYIGLLISQIGSSLTTVFSLAALAAAYNQLTASEAETDM